MARAQPDNLHSRLVGVLKVLLPLLALAILSTLFLVSRKINPEDAIPYADVDIEDRLRDPKMTGAALSNPLRSIAALVSVAASTAGATAAIGEILFTRSRKIILHHRDWTVITTFNPGFTLHE